MTPEEPLDDEMFINSNFLASQVQASGDVDRDGDSH
jgi:hypothetical protein